MLRRLCIEQPKQWYRFQNRLLFAYREVPQASTGFSPFELLYDRTIRGSTTFLKEFWTGESESTEVKITYEYLLKLRERLAKTMKLAQEELIKIRLDTKGTTTKRQKNDCLMKATKLCSC